MSATPDEQSNSNYEMECEKNFISYVQNAVRFETSDIAVENKSSGWVVFGVCEEYQLNAAYTKTTFAGRVKVDDTCTLIRENNEKYLSMRAQLLEEESVDQVIYRDCLLTIKRFQYCQHLDTDQKIYVHQSDKTLVHYRGCSICNKKGVVGCHTCYETGKVSCGSCSGNGNILCSTCNGTSLVTKYEFVAHDSNSQPVTRRCTRCQGGYNLCYTCDKTGKVNCRSCSGEGHINCQSCSATGWMSDRVKFHTEAHFKPKIICQNDADKVLVQHFVNKFGYMALSEGHANIEEKRTLDDNSATRKVTITYNFMAPWATYTATFHEKAGTVTHFGCHYQLIDAGGLLAQIVYDDVDRLGIEVKSMTSVFKYSLPSNLKLVLSDIFSSKIHRDLIFAANCTKIIDCESLTEQVHRSVTTEHVATFLANLDRAFRVLNTRGKLIDLTCIVIFSYFYWQWELMSGCVGGFNSVFSCFYSPALVDQRKDFTAIILMTAFILPLCIFYIRKFVMRSYLSRIVIDDSLLLVEYGKKHELFPNLWTSLLYVIIGIFFAVLMLTSIITTDRNQPSSIIPKQTAIPEKNIKHKKPQNQQRQSDLIQSKP